MTTKRRNITALIVLFVVLTTLACSLSISANPTLAPVPTAQLVQPVGDQDLKIIVQRLQVIYHALDGSKLIGTGCPGNDNKGEIENIHFTVQGIDPSKRVSRIVVAGDNSTLTWERPCSGAWGLEAIQGDNGKWEVYIAPSEPTEIYTLLFLYEDNSMAMGMVKVE